MRNMNLRKVTPLSRDVDNNQVQLLRTIFEKAQTNESLHVKYFKELNNIYEKMEHTTFMEHFLRGLRVWLKFDETNTYANLGLKFCAEYLTSLDDDASEDTHPTLVSTFDFLLTTVSLNSTVRFRLCQFVNLMLTSMGSEADLDDNICNNIMKYMLDRMKDRSAVVRVHAVRALQRLQTPENPNDKIVRSYLFHLSHDPSSAVRMAIVTAVGRNFHTMPTILERLWDIDDCVRRHTYLQLCGFPVRCYNVVQRVTLLEQGLNDDSDSVRKVVKTVLLPQWLQSYQRKYIAFVSALKMDANDNEFKRFVKIAKQALFILFKNESVDQLKEALPLTPEGGEFEKCVPFDKLTMEITVYWLSLIEYLQSVGLDGDDNGIDDGENYLQDVICELSTFCNYLTRFLNYIAELESDDADQWAVDENRYEFMILVDILLTFDLGDEFGRKNLKKFIVNVLSTRIVEEEIIQRLVCCVENLIPNAEHRLQFFVEIVRGYTGSPDSTIDFGESLFAQVLDGIKDSNKRMKFTQLRLKILDLREQETNATAQKDYERVEKLTEELAPVNDEMLRFVNETCPEYASTINSTPTLDSKKMTNESTLQCLQICFYAVASKNTSTLTANMCELYKDFIRRQMESKDKHLRDWALKCGIACSMLYEQLAKDAFDQLTNQFYKHHNTSIWTTSIKGVFELIDKYGFEYFETKTKTRQLYNTLGLEWLNEQPDDDEREQGRDIIYLFVHFMYIMYEETSIIRALITGFCRLVLSGRFQTSDIVSKLMLRFFSPDTDPETNQILAIFFQALIKRQRQECLAEALLPTLLVILKAPKQSPLHEVKQERVIEFVLNSTMPECSSGPNIHNDIALQFLSVMNDNINDKNLLKLLAKELLTLKVSDDSLKLHADNLLDRIIDPKTKTYIKSFQEILAGMNKSSGSRPTNDNVLTGFSTIADDKDENALVEEHETDKQLEVPVVQNRTITTNDNFAEQKQKQTKFYGKSRSGINVGNGAIYNATERKRPHEEYVSGATTTLPRASKLRYTPSKMVDVDVDKYEPTQMSITGVAAGDKNAAPDNRPSPLNNNDHQAGVENLNEADDLVKAERERREVNEIIRQKIETNTLTDSNGNQIGLTRVIHLKELTNEELTGTFGTHEADLRHIFKTRKCECPLRPSKEYSWFTINQIMITDQQMGAMLDALTMNLTNVEEHGHIPFDKLFWECMLPEWTLRIFMDRFVLTREEALDHLRKHERANIFNARIDFDFL